jgi:hypothetical protein
MKKLWPLFLLIGCEAPKDAPTDVQAQSCSKSLACSSTLNWHLQVNRNNLPQKISLKVGDAIILDECQGDHSAVRIHRDTTYSTIEMDNYSSASEGETFPLQINDCLLYSTYYSQPQQTLTIKTVNGNKTAWLEIF